MNGVASVGLTYIQKCFFLFLCGHLTQYGSKSENVRVIIRSESANVKGQRLWCFHLPPPSGLSATKTQHRWHQRHKSQIFINCCLFTNGVMLKAHICTVYVLMNAAACDLGWYFHISGSVNTVSHDICNWSLPDESSH